jgi:hypothetical protein
MIMNMQFDRKLKNNITLVLSTVLLAGAALFVEEPLIKLLGLQEHEPIAFLLGSIAIAMVALTVRYLPNTAADERCDVRIHDVAVQVHKHVIDAHLQLVRDLLVKLHHLHLDVATDREKEELTHNIKQAIQDAETKLKALETLENPEVLESYNKLKL